MKKILATISMAAVVTLIHAQGYIEYYGSSANIQTNTAIGAAYGGPGDTSGAGGKIGNATSGESFYFELLVASTTITGSSAPTNSAWTPVTAFGGGALALGTNGIGPGGLYGPGASGGVATSLTAGTAYSVELVGWSSALGTLSQALATIAAGGSSLSGQYLGWTGVGTITPFATQGAGDPTIFPTTFANGSMVMNAVSVVPEPGTLALAALGGASLLMFRRKK